MTRPPGSPCPPRSPLPVIACLILLLSSPCTCLAAPRHGADLMRETHAPAILVGYFETFLKDKDIEAFQASVMARYTEGTLGRVARSGTLQARRAAILALGLVGSFESNQVVAKCLADSDVAVRNLAQNALWAIWFRADTPENNASLQEVRDLIGRERFAEALAAADRLIARSPTFAEAHNQKAIILFAQGRFRESASACRKVLKHNPYHIGALGGLGQCEIKLERYQDALSTFRKALSLQPYSEGLRETISVLEAEVE